MNQKNLHKKSAAYFQWHLTKSLSRLNEVDRQTHAHTRIWNHKIIKRLIVSRGGSLFYLKYYLGWPIQWICLLPNPRKRRGGPETNKHHDGTQQSLPASTWGYVEVSLLNSWNYFFKVKNHYEKCFNVPINSQPYGKIMYSIVL